MSHLSIEFSKWTEAYFQGGWLMGVWSPPSSSHGNKDGCAHGPLLLALPANQGSLLISAFALNTEVHKGVNKTRKKPLELEKDYL